MKEKRFHGEAKMYGRGVAEYNLYAFGRDNAKRSIVELSGVYTEGELRALADAIMFQNQENFSFPNEEVNPI